MPTYKEYKIAVQVGNDFVVDNIEKGFIVKEEVIAARRATIFEVTDASASPGANNWSGASGNFVYKPSFTEVKLKGGHQVIIKRNLADFKTDMGI